LLFARSLREFGGRHRAEFGPPGKGRFSRADDPMIGDDHAFGDHLHAIRTATGVVFVVTAVVALVLSTAAAVGRVSPYWLLLLFALPLTAAPLYYARRSSYMSHMSAFDHRGLIEIFEQLALGQYDAETLERQNRQFAAEAGSYAHPLLAADFLASAERLRGFRARRPPSVDEAPPPADTAGNTDGRPAERWSSAEFRQLNSERLLAKKNRARLKSARLAYRLNLPLTKDAAANFAAARMGDRLDRLASVMIAYLPPTTPSDGRDV
jgi:hypothetical protein